MNFKKKRGQISFEYLSIVSFGIAVLLVAIYLFYSYSVSSNDTFIVSRVEELGNQIIDNAEILYYSTAKGSSINLELNFPTNVKDVYFINSTGESELVIKYSLRRGLTEAVFFTPIELKGDYVVASDITTYYDFSILDFHPGATKLKITNFEGGVRLCETT